LGTKSAYKNYSEGSCDNEDWSNDAENENTARINIYNLESM